MADPCERCGRVPWYANTREHFDSGIHCLAHSGALDQVRACAAYELSRLRLEVPELRMRVLNQNARLLELEGRINTPHTDDWFEAVRLEAAHQIERWGVKRDEGKTAPEWFWLLGHLSSKALIAWKNGDIEKMKHHCVSSGACLLNWFRRLTGDSAEMRPGIADPEAHSG